MRVEKSYVAATLISALVTAALSSIAVVEVLFLRDVLGAGYAMIGSLIGPAAIAFLVFSPFLMIVADRMGAGRYLVWTLLILALGTISAAILHNAGLYLAPKLVLWLLAPMIIPAVIGVLRQEYRLARDLDYLLFWLIIAASIGGAVGAVASGYIADAFSLAHSYVFSAALFGLAAIAAGAIPNNEHPRSFRSERLDAVERLSLALKKPYSVLAFVVLITNLHWAARDYLLPLLLRDAGHSTAAIGWVFGIASVSAALFAFPARRLLSKNHPRTVLIAGSVLFTAGAFILPFGPVVITGLAVALIGMSGSVLSPAVADTAEEDSRSRDAGRVMSAITSFGMLAWAVTPLAIGIFLEAGTPARVLLFLSALPVFWAYTKLYRAYGGDRLFPRLSWRKKQKLHW